MRSGIPWFVQPKEESEGRHHDGCSSSQGADRQYCPLLSVTATGPEGQHGGTSGRGSWGSGTRSVPESSGHSTGCPGLRAWPRVPEFSALWQRVWTLCGLFCVQELWVPSNSGYSMKMKP